MPQSCQSILMTVAVVLGAAVGCRGKPSSPPASSALGPEEPRFVTRSDGPIASSKVPPGVLTGIVIDAATGAPLPRAQLVVLYEGSVLADSNGRFRVTLPKKSATLQVNHEGYIATNTSVSYRDSGYVAVFALHRNEYRCLMSVGPVRWPGVVVIARDVVTGEAPPETVSVTASDSVYRDSITARADSTRRLVMRTARSEEHLCITSRLSRSRP